MDKIPAPSPTAPPPRSSSIEPTKATPEEGRFRKLFHELTSDIDRGRGLIQRSLRANGQLSSSQLLVLQAGMYRYAETVELVSKVVDKTTTAVRSTLQNQ